MNFHKLSWLLPIANLLLMVFGILVFKVPDYPKANIVFCFTILLLFLTGLIFGILGLVRRRINVSKSAIAQSIIGIVFNLFFLILLTGFVISGIRSASL